METRFMAICESYGIICEREDHKSGLDFFLPGLDVYVEVKQFHSPRISEQMSRKPNVIVIQGMGAMEAFATLLAWTI